MSWLDTFGTRVGGRYLRAGGSGFSRLVNIISVIGLSLGITLMIVVSSVHHGLSAARQASLFDVVPHAFLNETDGTPSRMREILELEQVVDVAREFHGTVLVHGNNTVPLTFNLAAVESNVEALHKLPLKGGDNESLLSGNAIVIARSIAMYLGIEIGENLDLTFVKPSTHGLRTRTARFKVSGLFNEGIEVNIRSGYVNIDHLESLQLLDSGQVGWNISVADPVEVESVFEGVEGIVTWVDNHGEAFLFYRIERAVMYLVMTLVLLLAAFNIVAGQSMLINVKRKDIAILVTMGASRRQLLSAFAIQGCFITLLGIALGVIGGLSISLNFNAIFEMIDEALGVSLLEGSRFDAWPSQISTVDVVGAVVIATVLGGVALVRPISLALRENPVFALNRSS